MTDTERIDALEIQVIWIHTEIEKLKVLRLKCQQEPQDGTQDTQRQA